MTYGETSAPSHSLGANQAHRLQWHHAEACQDLPLRAQFRIRTGFPYSTTLNIDHRDIFQSFFDTVVVKIFIFKQKQAPP